MNDTEREEARNTLRGIKTTLGGMQAGVTETSIDLLVLMVDSLADIGLLLLDNESDHAKAVKRLTDRLGFAGESMSDLRGSEVPKL